eukprot:8830156-Alexandrium_andersonii.AAC.1
MENYACAGVWAGCRSAACGFEVQTKLCPKCEVGEDHVLHRMWLCPATAGIRAQLFTDDEITAAQMHLTVVERTLDHADAYAPYKLGKI